MKLKKLKSKFENSTPTRYNRIRNYLQVLEENIEIENKRDKKNVEELKKISQAIITKIKKYTIITSTLYVAIYFSFISIFLPDIFIFSEISLILSRIIGILGTTIFIIGIVILNKISELLYQDLTLIVSHIISIYTKYQKEIVDDISSERKNTYEVFLEFFKKRYD